MKTFTVQEVIDAIRKDGWKKAYGAYWKDSNGDYLGDEDFDFETIDRSNIDSACALGQAALNLDVNPIYLETALNSIPIKLSGYEYETSLGVDITRLNDNTRNEDLTLPQIADNLEAKLSTAIKNQTIVVKSYAATFNEEEEDE